MERHKLILFPISGVGDSDWRRLIRRIMGFSDWKEDERQFDGLVYLSDFNHTQASELMTRHDYTRAIFVREPKLRLLSTYLERVQPDRGESFRDLCCQGLRRCMRTEDISFDFFVETIRDCDEPFWRPQIYRMEPKYWKFVNFVGHYQSIRHDTERLLTKLGLWDLFGKTGWGGKTGEGDAIFTNISYIHNETLVRNYLTPLAEKMAQKFSKSDYDAKEILQFSRNLQLEPATQSSLIQR